MIDVVGNRARTQILHLLSAEGRLTTAQLTEGLGANRSATYRHLLELEKHGYIQGDPAPAERSSRRTVFWVALQERIDEAAAIWHRFASGKAGNDDTEATEDHRPISEKAGAPPHQTGSGQS